MDRQVNVASILSGKNTSRQANTSSSIEPSLSSHSLNANAAQKQANRLSTPVELCNAAHFANLKDIQVIHI